MATFGEASLAKLATCHPDIQKVMAEAIKQYDFTVIFGHRSTKEQFKLYKIGRTITAGKWVITGKTVTNLDGVNKMSKHNYSPSKAIDIAPYPIDWSNIDRFKNMAQIVKNTAINLGINLEWGGDWKSFRDYPHFEIK